MPRSRRRGALAAPAPASADLASSLEAHCQLRDAADGDTATGPTGCRSSSATTACPTRAARRRTWAASRRVAVPAAYSGAGLPAKDPAAAAPCPATARATSPSTPTSRCPTRACTRPARRLPARGVHARLLRGQKAGWEADTIEGGGRELALQQRLVRLARLRGAQLHLARLRERPEPGLDRPDASSTRAFEINDFQHLAGQLADDTFTRSPAAASDRPAAGGHDRRLLRRRASPGWRSPTRPGAAPAARTCASRPRRPSTAGPTSRTRWCPTATTARRRCPSTDGAATRDPPGSPSAASRGRSTPAADRRPAGSPTPPSPPEIDAGPALPQLAATRSRVQPALREHARQHTLPGFINDRSAYYQNDFFDRPRERLDRPRAGVQRGHATDPLFPAASTGGWWSG